MFLFYIILTATFTLAQKDPATDQILYFKKRTEGPVGIITASNGAPVSYDVASNSINNKLINNIFFMETITHLNRERIPERIVHAKGAGAFGYFVVTKDISNICKAKFLEKVGKKTPVVVRFSPATGEKGFTDLNRDPRGFSIRFQTEEGNFDIPGFNTPMYFYKDPIDFHTFVHAIRRNPATNLFDPKTIWDAFSLRPVALHMFILIFADRGIPASYRNMPGYGIHSYQVVNKNGESYFFRFHILPDAGIKNLGSEEARNISASDPDYLTRDLFRAIARGDSPTWMISVQIFTIEDVKKLGPRAFDVTRVIPLDKFPLHEVGKLILNRNPKNFFAEIEQLAFCPSNLVPGILGGPDKLYESRRLAYRDAQLYRLGVNVNKIPVNCPFQVKTYTYSRDGVPPVKDNEKDNPNYYPNTFHGPVPYISNIMPKLIDIDERDDEDNFDQASELYNEFPEDEKVRLVENLVFSLSQVTKLIQRKIVKIFTVINSDLGNRVGQALFLSANVTTS